MAIIRCTAGADGKLTPVTVEFEAGDIVEFQSGDSTADSAAAIEVRQVFTLDALSKDQDHLMIRIDIAGAATPARTLPNPAPKLPPPPLGDGAFKFGRESGNSIKVVVDTRP